MTILQLIPIATMILITHSSSTTVIAFLHCPMSVREKVEFMRKWKTQQQQERCPATLFRNVLFQVVPSHRPSQTQSYLHVEQGGQLSRGLLIEFLGVWREAECFINAICTHN